MTDPQTTRSEPRTPADEWAWKWHEFVEVVQGLHLSDDNRDAVVDAAHEAAKACSALGAASPLPAAPGVNVVQHIESDPEVTIRVESAAPSLREALERIRKWLDSGDVLLVRDYINTTLASPEPERCASPWCAELHDHRSPEPDGGLNCYLCGMRVTEAACIPCHAKARSEPDGGLDVALLWKQVGVAVENRLWHRGGTLTPEMAGQVAREVFDLIVERIPARVLSGSAGDAPEPER